MQKNGMLFVFEGPDGAGKSTLAKSFADYLNSIKVPCDLFAFPGNEKGSLGHHIYELHHDLKKFDIKEISPISLQILHIAAHIDSIQRNLVPKLESGQNIVLDRFWWSTWVYGTVNGVDEESLRLMITVELYHWRNYSPTTVFLVDRRESLRNLPIKKWNRLRAIYYELMGEEKNKYPIQVIDNNSVLEAALGEVLKVYATIKIKKVVPFPQQQILLTPEERSSQLSLAFNQSHSVIALKKSNITVHTKLAPVEPTEVFDTYWFFAAERQKIFFCKLNGEHPPWTQDPILARYKFTNVYRASDRVSQYLIKHVIYQGNQSAEELFFRILLFKIFNRIETWELLTRELGEITYHDYSFERYDNILSKALIEKNTIFSAAYIMPSGKESFGHSKKHRNYLRLIENMLKGDIPRRLSEIKSMKAGFDLLRSYPMMGDFLAYQYIIDINYSELTNFSESEFVVPGPGARNGIRKCFKNFGGLNEIDLIQITAERQEEEFVRLGIEFPSLWGRRLQLIDCQNLFCEVDKYARVAHPEIKGVNNRIRIKQIYKANTKPVAYWYPPKWGINHLINQGESNDTYVQGDYSK